MNEEWEIPLLEKKAFVVYRYSCGFDPDHMYTPIGEQRGILGVCKHNNKYYVFYDEHWPSSRPEAVFDTEEEMITYIEMVYL